MVIATYFAIKRQRSCSTFQKNEFLYSVFGIEQLMGIVVKNTTISVGGPGFDYRVDQIGQHCHRCNVFVLAKLQR